MITEALLFAMLISPAMSATTSEDRKVPNVRCERAGLRVDGKRVLLRFKLSRDVDVVGGERVKVRWTSPRPAGCPNTTRIPDTQRDTANGSFRTWRPQWLDGDRERGVQCPGIWTAEIVLLYDNPQKEFVVTTLRLYVR